MLQLPAVADKTFLITIGDRTVGGLVFARPDGRAVAGAGGRRRGDADGLHTRFAGEAMAMGERTPLALIDAPASGRMAVGEAITNIAAAAIARLGDVKLSANWMAPAGHPGEDAALYDTVRAVAMKPACPATRHLSIPVGKDSMSMRTTWTDGVDKAVTAPMSLIVSAFAPVTDARSNADAVAAHWMRRHGQLVLIDMGAGGRRRLGGSALAQVYGQLGNDAPDLDDPQSLGRVLCACPAWLIVRRTRYSPITTSL